MSCAVTPDGRRVVSASWEETLKVWDLTTYKCLLTHRGDTSFTAVAATATTICAGDAAGTFWLLDWPPSLMPSPPVLEPHPGPSPRHAPTKRPRKRRTHSSKNLILFLAANPSNTSELALGNECAAIQRILRSATHRDFDLQSRWAVSIDAMMDHLNELSPTIVHFSGHGTASEPAPVRSSVPHLDIVLPDAGSDRGGIYLQDEHGGPQLVTARALTMVIESAAASTRVVVLNACYTAAQAEALRSVVDCVIGMTGAIGDDAARSFAVGFYRALGSRRSVGNAVDQAVATLAAKQLPDEHLPCCRARDGVDAHRLVLRVPARRRRRPGARS